MEAKCRFISTVMYNLLKWHRPPSCNILSSKLSSVASSANTGEQREESTTNGNLPLERREWTRSSKRTGAIALKVGMSHLWNSNGNRIAVTLLQILDNQVVQVRTVDKEGYSALQIGAVNHPKPHKIPKALCGHFSSVDVPPKRKLWEFRVTEDALLPPGTSITAAHFTPGQYVDVCATTIGKGFQGVMKRHGMSGQPASHGVTKTHRKMGATGGGGDPGRIWPGKRMPGRMGCKRRTVPSLKVYRINHTFNVLYVRGAVPGHRMQYVRVTDARRKPHPSLSPFPTHIPTETEALPEEVFSDDIHLPFSPTIEVASKLKQNK